MVSLKTIGILTLFMSALSLPSMLLAQGAPAVETKELSKVTVTCQWLPQAQFAGFYMAKEKGFYRKYGLEVEIAHSNATASNITPLLEGKTEFVSLFLAPAIRVRADGHKIVNLAQLFRHSSMVMVSRKSSGIKGVQDLNGKRIGIWHSDFRDTPLQFLKQHNINAEIVFMNASIDLFLWGGVDVMLATTYNEMHALMMCGMSRDEMFIINLKDNGLDIPEDGIYCLESFYLKNPELCRHFALATMEGWRYAVEHPQETVETVERLMHELHLPVARCHQFWMLKEVGKLIFPNGVNAPNVPLSASEYSRTAELLRSAERIKTIPPFETFRSGVSVEPTQRK